MANNDSSSNVLRFNEISQLIEYAVGANWFPIAASAGGITQLTGDVTAGPGAGSQPATIANNVITNAMINSAAAIAYSKLNLTNSIVAGDLTSGSITPAKISTSTSDDFTFPHNVTVANDLFVQPSESAQTATLTLGNASSATALLSLGHAIGDQGVIEFNANNQSIWDLLHQVDNTFEVVDAVNSLVVETFYQGGGVRPTVLTTTQRNALTGVAGMVIYNSTTSQIEFYNGTNWVSKQGSPATVVTGTGTVTPNALISTTISTTVVGALAFNGPTGGVDGQKITFRLLQDSTGHTVTFNTGSGNFSFGTDITSFTASGANLTDYIGVIYNATQNLWNIVSVSHGF